MLRSLFTMLTSLAVMAVVSSGEQAHDVSSPQNVTAARMLALMCTQPPGAVKQWSYDGAHYRGQYVPVGFQECGRMRGYDKDNGRRIAMLNMYRSGGEKNTNWIHTKDVNDPRCLENWTYYAKDGKTVLAQIQGRTTMQGDKKRWCGLPVMVSTGVQGKQWEYCDCKNVRE